MKNSDRAAFAQLISGVMAYHRQPMSDQLMEVWWRGCQRWEFEQVATAIDALTADPEAGKFPPKIGDITRVLEGTHTDRSMLAWGKVLESMRSIGAYQDVVFDDPAIHAAVEDMGGWSKLCRSELSELGYVQTAFCKAHKAYVGRGTFEYPRKLLGDRGGSGSDHDYAKRGLPPPTPVLIGDTAKCKRVYDAGGTSGKVAMTFKNVAALLTNANERFGEPSPDQSRKFLKYGE